MGQLFTQTCTNQTTSWCIDKPQAYIDNKIYNGPNLGEAIIFPFIVFYVINHGGCTQMSFFLETPKLGVPKFPKLKLPTLWRLVTSYATIRLKWGLKQSCSPSQELSNAMWHANFTHVNQGDYWLLMVKSQIGTLIINPSFGHNLYFKYSNGSCKLILNIYVSKSFQWYKEHFNPMNFGP